MSLMLHKAHKDGKHHKTEKLCQWCSIIFDLIMLKYRISLFYAPTYLMLRRFAYVVVSVL